MASRFFKKICALFYQPPTMEGEEHTFRTINGVFGDWRKSAADDLPPPYTDLPESKTQFQDEQHSPPPPFASPCLQICPHETLSFETLQEIADSLAVRDAGETIEALTLSCREHRSQLDNITKSAKYVCVSSPSLLRGFGTCASQVSKDQSHTPSIVLRFHWDLGFLDGIRGQVENAAELQHFLGADGIWLCPHKQINDSDIINAIYAFVKRLLGREVITCCDRCDTEIRISSRMEGDDETCRVTTKRRLGTLKNADDPVWLAQCGV